MRYLIKYVLVIGLALYLGHDATAQRRGRQSQMKSLNIDFLEKQWWIGLRGGANLSKAAPVAKYSVFSPTQNDRIAAYDKTYDNYKGAGAVTGLEITYNYKSFSLSLQPNFRRIRFFYSNEYEWKNSERQDQRLQLTYEQDHQLDYLEIPLFLKYDILQGAIKPFVQAGFYYGMLNNANKKVYISGIDEASGGTEFSEPPVIVGANDLFIRSSFGYAGGVGVSYELGNIRLIVDAVYRHGTNNITNRANRFSNNHLSGSGDALDDIKLRNITFSFGILMPMRFLDTNYFKASEKK